MDDEIIFFDLETTGIDPNEDRIVQMSVAKIDLEFNLLEKKNILFNPGIPIPKGASDVHGITDEMVKDCPKFSDYDDGMFEYFNGKVLGGYNIKKFDVPLLWNEFFRCGKNLHISRVVDVYLLFLEMEKRTLSYAYNFYCGKTLEGAHDAENDNVATVEIFQSQLLKYDIGLGKSMDICNDPKALDMDGWFILNDSNQPIYNKGKDKSLELKKSPGFAEWMLRQTFVSNQTKNVISSILYGG